MVTNEELLVSLRQKPRKLTVLARDFAMPYQTLRTRMKADPGFGDECKMLSHGVNIRALSAPKTDKPDRVPDFLPWRSLHCAYIDPRQAKVVRAVNNWFQRDAYAKLQAHNRLIMVLPPGHIKTTFFGIEHSTWAINRDRNVRILNIQKNEQEAAKVIAAVQERLTDHDYYASLAARLVAQGEEPVLDPIIRYGGKAGFKPKTYREGEKWGTYGFQVSQRTSGEKDFTMQAKGAGSQIQGIRADKIILDDIQDPARISPTNTDQMLEWFRRVILGRVYDWQQVVILANLFHPADFASRIIEEYPDWPVIRYPAITDEEAHTVLCPEVWTYDGLVSKRKEVGESIWHYTWMQREGTFEDAVFTREKLLEARNRDYVIGKVPEQVTHVFLGCDPAISQFCAICAWGLDVRTGVRYLIDIFNQDKMRTFAAIQAKILDFVGLYAPRTVAIEMNNLQGSISNDPEFVRDCRSYGARVVTYQTRTEMGARREADDFDISSIGALFDSDLVVLPYGDSSSEKIVDAYIAQLLEWRPGVKYLTRDMVMATLFAECEARTTYLQERNRDRNKKAVNRAPAWAKNSLGGWRWQRPKETLPLTNLTG